MKYIIIIPHIIIFMFYLVVYSFVLDLFQMNKHDIMHIFLCPPYNHATK